MKHVRTTGDARLVSAQCSRLVRADAAVQVRSRPLGGIAAPAFVDQVRAGLR